MNTEFYSLKINTFDKDFFKKVKIAYVVAGSWVGKRESRRTWMVQPRPCVIWMNVMLF